MEIRYIVIISFLAVFLTAAKWPVTGRGYVGSVVFSGQVIESASIDVEVENDRGFVVLNWRVNIPHGLQASGSKIAMPGDRKVFESEGVRIAVIAPPIASQMQVLARMER